MIVSMNHITLAITDIDKSFLATANLLAHEGVIVIVADVDETQGEETVCELLVERLHADFIKLDVTEPSFLRHYKYLH